MQFLWLIMLEEVILPFRLVRCDNPAPTIIQKRGHEPHPSLLEITYGTLTDEVRVRFKVIILWTPCPRNGTRVLWRDIWHAHHQLTLDRNLDSIRTRRAYPKRGWKLDTGIISSRRYWLGQLKEYVAGQVSLPSPWRASRQADRRLVQARVYCRLSYSWESIDEVVHCERLNKLILGDFLHTYLLISCIQHHTTPSIPVRVLGPSSQALSQNMVCGDQAISMLTDRDRLMKSVQKIEPSLIHK